ncbi:hypothetical protein SM0020_12415 [Sinorhizobium meliloti CCNWSX0020]|uniref:Uncharacterized protein n=1 Tax=Sinorhizobium meliloti CCNWSX0020 TaxID=1107881 RepID=H0FZ49_RHIML|nr:hypothetical protein [Sinorhizobium meliloti]EHK77729.1 hypothetical protein SM0020_12415 [Sinorhizobium meliloti CCNWSX0020]
MVDRPILFSAPMVRALHDGSKTQTRRVIKKPAALDAISVFGHDFLLKPGNVDLVRFAVGDRLWVREEFSGPHHFKPKEHPPAAWPIGCDIWYWADGNPDFGDWTKPKRSMHMPRWMSRLTLIVTRVNVERLQDISETDAIAEGIQRHHAGWMPYTTAFYEADGVTPANFHPDPRESYRSLWNAINGFGAWEANPWVVAVTSTIIKENIDRIAA